MRTRYTIVIPFRYRMDCKAGDDCSNSAGNIDDEGLDQGSRTEKLKVVPSWNAKVDYQISRYCTQTVPSCPDSELKIELVEPPRLIDSYIVTAPPGYTSPYEGDVVPIAQEFAALATLTVDVDEDCGACRGGPTPPLETSGTPSDSNDNRTKCKCRVTTELGPFSPSTHWIKDPETGDLMWCTKWTRKWRQECFDVTDPEDDPRHSGDYLSARAGMEAKAATGDISELQITGSLGDGCYDTNTAKCCNSDSKKCCENIVMSWLDCPNGVSNFVVGSGASPGSSPDDGGNRRWDCPTLEVFESNPISAPSLMLTEVKGGITHHSTLGGLSRLYEFPYHRIYFTPRDADGHGQLDICGDNGFPNGARIKELGTRIASLLWEAITETEDSTGVHFGSLGKGYKYYIEEAAKKNKEMCTPTDPFGFEGTGGNHIGIEETMEDIRNGLCRASACVINMWSAQPGGGVLEEEWFGCIPCQVDLLEGIGYEQYGTSYRAGPCLVTNTLKHQKGPGDPRNCTTWGPRF